MQYRQLGASGLRVSVLTMGTMTFGGTGGFASVGSTGVEEAGRQVDQCLDAGINLIDTANVYSGGLSEEILGKVLEGRRDQVLVATKARMPMGEGPNDAGLSRHHLVRECEASLRRLGTDRIDLYQVHEWDGQTPLDETLAALDDLVRAGKVRYVGCSNYAGWQLMKALGIAERRGLSRFVSQQIHYTLQAREAEYESVPIAVDQGLGLLVWSPLAGGLLSGKYRRDQPGPEESRLLSGWDEPPRPRPGQALRHRRGPGGGGVRARCLPGPGGAGLAAGAAGGHLGDYRRPHLRAAGRQPRRRRPFPDRRGAGAVGGGQPAAVALPLLASGQDRHRPARSSRPVAARPSPSQLIGSPGRPRPSNLLFRR